MSNSPLRSCSFGSNSRYLERQAKPRRADDATRITLVALVVSDRLASRSDRRETGHGDPMASKGLSAVLGGSPSHVADRECLPICNG